MSTRKTPLLIASLQEMGINISGPVENLENSGILASEVGQDPEVVAVLPERSQLTLPGHPGSQPSVSALTNIFPNLVPPRDELFASGESDSNGHSTPGEDLQRTRATARSYEYPHSTHVVNAEVFPRIEQLETRPRAAAPPDMQGAAALMPLAPREPPALNPAPAPHNVHGTLDESGGVNPFRGDLPVLSLQCRSRWVLWEGPTRPGAGLLASRRPPRCTSRPDPV
jgi:hypothetical protein